MRIINSNYSYSIHVSDQLKPSTLPEFAFIGRSNVGKSSLINSLLNRKNLAQTSKKPGKTRAINIYDIVCYDNNNKKEKLHFADLPGYGFAQVSKNKQVNWKELMEDYIKFRNNLSGFVIIIDIRHSLTKKDVDAINWIYSFGTPFIIAATKRDKLKKSKIKSITKNLKSEINPINPQRLITFSAKTNFGKGKILNWIDSNI